MKPVLQVALDLVHGERALSIASDAVKGGVDWIEAGTPLIKSEGMSIIRQLKKAFPMHTVVADMKTIDVGGAEVEMAAKSGAEDYDLVKALFESLHEYHIEVLCPCNHVFIYTIVKETQSEEIIN
jgi:3-keto-L-gulonate-6-phosphate decarboxylase